MIGVYDSGYGGLTVLRELAKALPDRDFLYLGDNGRAPYGGRDVHTVLDFAEQSVEALFEAGCRLVVVACNTVSCVALRHLQQRYAPPGGDRRVLGVTIPGAELATRQSRGHIGILATPRTVESRTYCAESRQAVGPSGVAAIRAAAGSDRRGGFEGHEIARLALREYLADLPGIDTLLLGCTHYPLLRPLVDTCVPEGVSVVDPGPWVAESLVAWLGRHPRFDEPVTKGTMRFLTTGDPDRFAESGARFFGQPLLPAEPLEERGGRLVARAADSRTRGQIVR